jgi:hypothetical protein
MLTAPAAAEVSAAVVVQLRAEAQLLVPAPLPQDQELPALAPPVLPRVPVRARWQVVVGLARLPVVAHRVVEAAVPVQLLSRQSCSAAMAGSTP